MNNRKKAFLTYDFSNEDHRKIVIYLKERGYSVFRTSVDISSPCLRIGMKEIYGTNEIKNYLFTQ